MENKIRQIEQGKAIFEAFFEIRELEINDSFLLILTENEECINYGIKYLPAFISMYHKRNVYVLLTDVEYADAFSKAGGTVKICSERELKCLTAYFDLFQRKQFYDTSVVTC